MQKVNQNIVNALTTYSKQLDTGARTRITNGHIEVFSELEWLNMQQQAWWERVLNIHKLN